MEEYKYKIVDGASGLDVCEVMGLLRQTYWASERTQEQVAASMEHSKCYGIMLDGERKLVGISVKSALRTAGPFFLAACHAGCLFLLV